MADIVQEFLDSLRTHHNGQVKTLLMPATVMAVDEMEQTITVECIDEIVLDDVRLTAVVDMDDEKVLLVPAIGSTVIIGNIMQDEEWCVVSFSKIDKLSYKIGMVDFEINQLGYKIQLGGQNLKTILTNMIDQVKAITVSVPAAPGVSTIPLNSVAFDPIKLGLENLLL